MCILFLIEEQERPSFVLSYEPLPVLANQPETNNVKTIYKILWYSIIYNKVVDIGV